MARVAPGRATVDGRKITDYLLDPAHPKGGPKARFLTGFGFSRDDPGALARALLRHLREGVVTRTVETPWGPRVHVEGSLPTPSGSTPRVRTVWQMSPDDSVGASFVTLKPLRRSPP